MGVVSKAVTLGYYSYRLQGSIGVNIYITMAKMSNVGHQRNIVIATKTHFSSHGEYIMMVGQHTGQPFASMAFLFVLCDERAKETRIRTL